MTVADYLWALVLLGGSLWLAGEIANPYVPWPVETVLHPAPKEYAAVVALLFAAAYFFGVLWTGEWGWLS